VGVGANVAVAAARALASIDEAAQATAE